MTITDLNLVDIRRHLHAHPELSLDEFETQRYLKNIVTAWQSPWLTIREIPALPTALLVRLTGKHPKRTIGYRADIDALPITEETGLPFSSERAGVWTRYSYDCCPRSFSPFC